MPQRRLNDTDALVAQPSRSGESYHVSTRKIDNGWVINESTCTDAGEYRSSERFSATPPRIIPGKVARNPAPDQGNPLRQTMDYMRDKDGVH